MTSECPIYSYSVTYAAGVRNENDTVQGAIGGLLATFIFGNINVLLGMNQSVPSRNKPDVIIVTIANDR